MLSLHIPVRVHPGASRNGVTGRYDGPHGPGLAVAVTAPAVDGRATEAAVRLVAKALGAGRGTVRVAVGATSRNKVLIVEPAPPEVSARFARLLGTDHLPNHVPGQRRGRTGGPEPGAATGGPASAPDA